MVSVDGEIDLSSVGKLIELIRAATDDGVPACVLDFENVTYIDSEGLKGLLVLKGDLQATGHELCFRGCSAIVRRVMNVLMLQDYVGCGSGCTLHPCE